MSALRAVLVVLLTTIPVIVAAQDVPAAEETEPASQSTSYLLRGSHRIELGVGFLGRSFVRSVPITRGLITDVGVEGFVGSVAYSYWAKNDLAIRFTVGLLAAEFETVVNPLGGSTETGSVVPVLIGMKYLPFGFDPSRFETPYVFASLGPCFGFATRSRTGVNAGNDTITERALALHLGVGADLSVSRVFALGVAIGYYLTTDFGEPIGGEKNYSTPEFSLSVGIDL